MAWLPSEDLLLLSAVRSFGAQWDRISTLLPGRTMDGVRNRWYRLQKNTAQQALLAKLVASNEALAAKSIKAAKTAHALNQSQRFGIAKARPPGPPNIYVSHLPCSAVPSRS